jgi:dienelactone hydrolase
MATVLLFHHAQGLTPGVLSFAEEVRRSGHSVLTPDLYQGKTFESIEEGVAYAKEIGFDSIRQNAARVADELPNDVVFAGFSLGGMSAQMLAQTRPSKGALLFHSSAPPMMFGAEWPADLPVQIHAMDADPYFMEDGEDIDAARHIVDTSKDAELFLYPGNGHLFMDSSLSEYDKAAADLVTERVIAFLADR